VNLVSFVDRLWSIARHARGGDGRRWESEVRDLLISARIRSEDVPGGYSLLGMRSASGLSHQLDLATHLEDAILVAELKAYSGRLPKNDLLTFVAATDDLYRGLGRYAPRLPIYRAIAGTFTVTEAERTYAAQNGVLLVEPLSIPSLILASPRLTVPSDFLELTADERLAAATLARSMQLQHSLAPSRPMGNSDGSRRADFSFGLRTQVQWSSRFGLDAGLTSLLPPGPESEIAA
jgi:hypothetical protein